MAASLSILTFPTAEFGVPTSSAPGDAAAAGSSLRPSSLDHVHGREAAQSVVTTASAAYTVLATTVPLYVLLTTSGATATLPAAATAPITIKNLSTGTATVSRAGSALIDGETTFVLPSQYAALTVIWDGTNWNVV